MNLQLKCTKCENTIRVKGNYSSRYELSEAHGKEINLSCKKCGNEDKYDIDRIKASPSKLIILWRVILLLCVLFFTYFLYPYAVKGIITLFILPVGILIPLIILGVIEKNTNNKVRNFNSSHIKNDYKIKFNRSIG